jgi:hypothetical protein
MTASTLGPRGHVAARSAPHVTAAVHAHASPATRHAPVRHGPVHIRGVRGVLVWWDAAWWAWQDDSWIVVDEQLVCGQWSAPIDTTTELRVYAAGELAATGGQPVTEQLGGRLYLFSEERGAVAVRVCVSETSTVGAPPAPPVPVDVSPHPLGRQGLRRSADEVAAQSRRDYRKWRVIQWARQAIADANLPDPRGRPNPDHQIAALFAALKKKTTFIKDPHNTECVGSTESILCLDPHGACLKGGDCDDMLVALGATAMAIGIPVRLVVKRYRGQKQAHIVLEYDSAPGPQTVWKCIDPSTESGTCSDKPVEEQFVTEVDMPNEAPVFIGIGEPHHDQREPSTLGDAPSPMSNAESQGWVTLLQNVQGELDRARARLASNAQAYANVRADLGFPQYDTAPSGEAGPQPGTSPLAYYTSTVSSGSPTWTSDAAAQEQKLLSTAAFLSSALADGLSGARALYFNQGDLYVEAKPGDPYRVLMNPNAQGVPVPTYFDNNSNPTGTVGFLPIVIGAVIAVVSLAAAYAVSKYCDFLASAHHDDALSKVSDNQTQLIAAGKETPDQANAQIKALQDLSAVSAPPANTSSSIENIAKYIAIGIVAIAAVAGLFVVARFVEAVPRRGSPASSGSEASPFMFEARRRRRPAYRPRSPRRSPRRLAAA